MAATHIELLVEDASMEAFLSALLPRLLPHDRTFGVHPFQGKSDLLGRLEDRLRAYARWLPADWRVLVVVDRDNDDCLELKQRLEVAAQRAGLRSRSRSGRSPWQLVNRIAVEELEAWYFGDWHAVQAAYRRVPVSIPDRQGFRNSDAIAGGTWEAFERVMKRYGYFQGGLRKIEAAGSIGIHLDPERSRSPSFLAFSQALEEAVG